MLAILAAVKEEIGPVLKSGRFSRTDGPSGALAYEGVLASGGRALVIASGMGRGSAEGATRWLLRRSRPSLIISAGFGGGTRAALNTGAIVIGSTSWLLEGTPLEWSMPVELESIRSHPGSEGVARMVVELKGIDYAHGGILTTPIVARSSGLKQWLGRQFGVYAVDQEGYWVARMATQASVPFLAVRVIVDPVDTTLPALVLDMPETPSGGRAGVALTYALRHPRNVIDVTRLARAANSASVQLARFLTDFSEAMQRQAGSVPRPAA